MVANSVADLITATPNLVTSITPFTLESLKGFPYQTYYQQQEDYSELEKWYFGTVLEEVVVSADGKTLVEKYPIKINPLRNTSYKHASVLFGTNLDSLKFGGIPINILADLPKEEKSKEDIIEKALRKTFSENGGGSLFISNGIVSQYMGGCIFAANWIPTQNRIQISNPHPREFIGIPYGTDYWHLREYWIIREIQTDDLPAYGLPIDQVGGIYWYNEHWTPDTYEIRINNTVLEVDGQKAQGTNPFGIAPAVYIPHIRTTGFIGKSIITSAIKGLIREMNLRFADIGDAVSEDSHTYTAVRNVKGVIRPISIGDGRPILDLGSVTGLSGNEANPDMFNVKTTSASSPMLSFTEKLTEMYRNEADHPAVADGMDEGSQRSAATLTARMWPLTSHAELERSFWTVGLVEFSKILLKMMAIKGINGVKKEHLEIPLIVQWSTMLPRDRDAIVQEAAIRALHRLGTKQHLIELFGDTQDPAAEMVEVWAEMKKEAEAMPQQTPFGGQAPAPAKGGGASGSKGNSRGSTKA
jgi:hypothetical protein